MKNRKNSGIFRKTFCLLGLIVFTQVGCDGSSPSSHDAPAINPPPIISTVQDQGTTEEKSAPLPASSEEARQIAKAADVGQIIGPDRWDREIQEANSDLHNPQDLDYFGNFNSDNRRGNPPRRNGEIPNPVGGNQGAVNPLPGGVPHAPEGVNPPPQAVPGGGNANPNPNSNPNPNPNPRDDQEDSQAEAAARAQQERINRCERDLKKRWSNSFEQCICDDQHGYYDFDQNPARLDCKRSIEKMIMDVNVSAHSGNNVGTDSEMEIEICSASQCKAFRFSTVGNFFNKGTTNRILMVLGGDMIVSERGIRSMQLRILGSDGVYIRDIAVVTQPFTGVNETRVGQRSYYNVANQPDELLGSLPRGNWLLQYQNTCVDRWMDSGRRATFDLGALPHTDAYRCGNDDPDEGETHWY